MSKQNSSLLTTTKAAQMLGVSRASVQSWVEKGMLRALKTPGGHRRIARDAVEMLLRRWNRSISATNDQDDINILIIESNPTLLQLYVDTMETWLLPLRLRTATDGFDGLIQVGQERPDLLIMASSLPGMDGAQMIHYLTNQAELRGIRIIFIMEQACQDKPEYQKLPTQVQVCTKPLAMEQIHKVAQTMVDAQQAPMVDAQQAEKSLESP